MCQEIWACCSIALKGSKRACICGCSCSSLRRRLDTAGADGAGHSRGRSTSSRCRGSRDALPMSNSGGASPSMSFHPVGRWTCCGMHCIASLGVLPKHLLQNSVPRQRRLLPWRWPGHCPQRLRPLLPQLPRCSCLLKVHHAIGTAMPDRNLFVCVTAQLVNIQV